MDEVFRGIGIMATTIVCGCVYIIPAFVATRRKKKHARIIGALNFFFGWTVGGWIVTLVWALTKD